MSTWLSIATGTTCLIVTIVGLILSFLALWKKGIRSGLRGIAWSLLPLAMYLTHAIGLVGRIGSAIVQFGTSFVFSPKAWLGVILVGISVLLFLISGGIPLLQSGRKREKRHKQKEARQLRDRDASTQATTMPAARPEPGAPPGTQPGPPQEDDLSDVQEILRRRGIK